MHTIIIYNHPYKGSFCHALLEATKKGAKAAGHTVDVIDLDSDGFNPVMSGQDLSAFRNHKASDPQAIDYANRIKKADHLVLIFPIWWELMPAMMKGFIDKVIFPGLTYNYTKSGYGMVSTLTTIKSTTVITTMNTPKIMYKFIYGNAIQKALIKGTFKKSGIKNVKWQSFNMVKASSDATRKKWLERIEKKAYQK
ncbi:NAD(P)H-dependent oxidoreductase [Listeria monocytogenes]|nr:flavodoxin family protein [Listeria monocytogenes]EAC9721764.1 flavodoxin family protein [Listeria monocytogenes]EAC9864723.1 flavodoxin family protein [Listeria monocytogenes]EAD0296483.1 flavodoxin family protein [Listeria monocytogenes]EAD0385897.1 flavodoxin family protein [Listeria monocytogenes]